MENENFNKLYEDTISQFNTLSLIDLKEESENYYYYKSLLDIDFENMVVI